MNSRSTQVEPRVQGTLGGTQPKYQRHEESPSHLPNNWSWTGPQTLHGPSELLLLSSCKPYPHHCSLIQPYSRAFAQNVLSLKIPLLPHPSLSPSNLDCWNSNPSTHLSLCLSFLICQMQPMTAKLCVDLMGEGCQFQSKVD